MNILMANLSVKRESDTPLENMQHLQFPTGLATIGGVIRRNRADAIFVIDDNISRISRDDLSIFIERHRIDCLLMSGYVGNYQYGFLKRIASDICQRFPLLKVIVGGPLATTVPEMFIRAVPANDEQVICVVGEGEETILDLLSCIDCDGALSEVAGICFKNGDVPLCTKPRQRIRRLTSDHFPDYDLFDTAAYAEYVKTNNRCWEISASRGCYNRCSYCKIVFGSTISFFSTESIVNEMEKIHHRYGIFRFNFVDDNFLNSEHQVTQFVEELHQSEISFEWRFQGRVERLNIDLIKKMREVGLFGVSLGIESGADRIIREMNKNIDLEKAAEVIKQLNDEGIAVHASFIVGMPSESPQTIEQTVRFIASAKPLNVNAGLLTLFPGTPLYDNAVKSGVIPDEEEYLANLGPVYTKPYINLTKYSDDQLIEWLSVVKDA